MPSIKKRPPALLRFGCADRRDDREDAVDERVGAEENADGDHIVAPGQRYAKMPKITATMPRMSNAHQLRAKTLTLGDLICI